jgi:hypothetical protein
MVRKSDRHVNRGTKPPSPPEAFAEWEADQRERAEAHSEVASRFCTAELCPCRDRDQYPDPGVCEDPECPCTRRALLRRGRLFVLWCRRGHLSWHPVYEGTRADCDARIDVAGAMADSLAVGYAVLPHGAVPEPSSKGDFWTEVCDE